MKFGIVTINNLRPKVLRLWCAQIRRLRYDLDCYIPAVCVSDIDDKPVCDEYNIVHFASPNKPVSNKFNIGFKYMYNIGMDYVIILGSDNIISTDLLRKIIAQMELGISLIGIKTIYFFAGDDFSKSKGKLIKLECPHILGVAKTISKDVLDCVAWRPFAQNKDWGIDAVGSKTIAPYVTTKAVVEGVCVDVKTKENLNKFSCFGRRLPPIDPNIFYNILGEEEKQLLNEL